MILYQQWLLVSTTVFIVLTETIICFFLSQYTVQNKPVVHHGDMDTLNNNDLFYLESNTCTTCKAISIIVYIPQWKQELLSSKQSIS